MSQSTPLPDLRAALHAARKPGEHPHALIDRLIGTDLPNCDRQPAYEVLHYRGSELTNGPMQPGDELELQIEWYGTVRLTRADKRYLGDMIGELVQWAYAKGRTDKTQELSQALDVAKEGRRMSR